MPHVPSASGHRGGVARVALLVGLAAMAACGRPGAPANIIRLTTPLDTVITPYGEITDAVWLGGQRWAVIAPQDRALAVADFGRRALSRFGGAMAKEIAQPFHLFRAGDSVYVADWFRRRETIWSLAGTMGSDVPALDAYRGALPKARDLAGRWYLELRPAPGPDGRGNLDSGVVLRTTPDLSRADTIGRLAPFDLVEVVSDGRRRLERRLLSGQDRWGVLPDGSLWIARITQNRVDWRDPAGKVTIGDQLPDRVLPVTENDRDLFLNRFDPGLRPTVSQIPFAAIKPAFETAVAAPDARLWLVKSRAIGDTLRDYQIIDRAGRLLGLASHPGLGRILALGGGYALVGEPFAAGVRLLLFRLPADTGAGRT
ncbi:MAG TPA: hypothetical protein VEI47_09080 [Gemmatimonadales bacterium]|nr:hypothetical protein [Gemmatimonadales bacterium]